jgi:hypothetical protein
MKDHLSHYVEGQEPRDFKEPRRSHAADFAHTEKAYSHDRSRPWIS